jgi:fido (protein-threonine AMPylation protein)
VPGVARDHLEESILAPFRLAHERRLAGVEGSPAQARALLKLELDGLRVNNLHDVSSFDVAEVLGQSMASERLVCLARVARALSGGSFGIGDPGSERTAEITGFQQPVARGSPIEVIGRWDPRYQRLTDTKLVTAGSLSDFDAAFQMHGHDSPFEPRPRDEPSAQAVSRPDEAALLPCALEALEAACTGGELSLGTLCRVHKLLADVPPGTGGTLRYGSSIVRRRGFANFVPPAAPTARADAEALVETLAQHLRTVRAQVPPAVLAAEAVARFTDLHPFADGNGRVARALASWLLVRAGYRSRPGSTLRDFFCQHGDEYYLTLRYHELDPWSWYQFFFDATLACFVPPRP